MTDQTSASLPAARRFSLPRLRVRHVLGLFIALVLLRALVALPALSEGFLKSDNDDLMRLVVVRDWLAGQGWFDTVQYRLLPPEGVAMHWSRYVDAGIAAFLAPLSWVLPQNLAEIGAISAWPTLLLCLLMALIAWGTARAMRDEAVPAAAPAAVAGALILAFGWIKFGGMEFQPGRIDHHNLQILFCTAAAFLSVVPSRRPGWFGALAGAAAAGSLAIGLEMLPFLLLLWGFAVLRFAFGQAGADRWLAGFAAAIGPGSLLLMAGQVPVAAWGTRWCDVLAPPMLSLVAAGVAATLPPALLAGRIRGPLPRLAVVLCLAGIGLALAAPLLGPCLAGPYSAVPEAAREIISKRITEAVPITALAGFEPEIFASLVLPVVVPALAALTLALLTRRDLGRAQGVALAQMLGFAAVGLGLSLMQNRAIAIAVPAVPFLAGFAAARLTAIGSHGHLRAAALAALAIWSLMLLPTLPLQLYRDARTLAGFPQAAPSGGSADVACRSGAAVANLAALPVSPPAEILSPLNLGAMILAYSPHAATSAPYHRSADAFWNGIAPFEDEGAMIAALRKSGATHVAVCRSEDRVENRAVAARLLAGDLPAWLSLAGGAEGPLLLFRVDPAALASAMPRPAPPAAEEATK